MGSLAKDTQREGVEIVYGAQACYQKTMELLSELGFPKGVLPLKDLEECGRVHETGFVWMKLRCPLDYSFKVTGTRVSYSTEVTAYVEKGKFKKMTGIKTRLMMMWVPLVEMRIIDGGKKIYFKTSAGIGRGFPAAAFAEEEEEEENREVKGRLKVN